MRLARDRYRFLTAERQTRSLDRSECRRPFEPRFFSVNAAGFSKNAPMRKKQPFVEKKCESHDAAIAATHNAVAHADRETWERCPSGTFELLSSE